MSAMVEAIREQTRMITEQNRLLGLMTEMPAYVFSAPGRMMSEMDLHNILLSDDVVGAIDRWNAGRKINRRLKP